MSEKTSKDKPVLKVLAKIDEQQLAREIGEILDSESCCRKLQAQSILTSGR